MAPPPASAASPRSARASSNALTRSGPYDAEVGRQILKIRVNDFPAEPVYSLFVDDEHVTDLEDWPPVWVKPG
jgi:hypothetical protein